MFSYPNSDAVLEGLGEKFVTGLAVAVTKTRHDLALYRASLPKTTAIASRRGMANWIHDCLWHNLVSEVQDFAGVLIISKEPVREIIVDSLYRIRVKRHNKKGRVSNYPTQMSLDFMSQSTEQLVLDGLAEVRLVAGYLWDQTTHEIGSPVLSLRDGITNVVWMVELPEAVDGVSLEPITASRAPAPPKTRVPSASIEDSQVNG